MITDSLWAYQVENNDFIVIDGEVIGYVYMVTEEEEFLHFDTVDEDGEHTIVPFGPFESVTIVTRWDDEDDASLPEDEFV